MRPLNPEWDEEFDPIYLAIYDEVGEAVGSKIWVAFAELRNVSGGDDVIPKVRKGVDRFIRLAVKDGWYGSNHN